MQSGITALIPVQFSNTAPKTHCKVQQRTRASFTTFHRLLLNPLINPIPHLLPRLKMRNVFTG